MIRAIIVDDEVHCIDTLAILLREYCPEVHISEQCRSAEKALQAIDETKPDLVFLDIEMPVMNGFGLLEQLSLINFEIIFTTSYDQYAIKAIRFSALDYLLKPIDKNDLQKAVQKVAARLQPPLTQQMEILLNRIRHPTLPVQKIALPTMEGLQMLHVDTIISCKSDSNYTTIYLKGNNKILVSKTLREVESMLEDYSFVRVHHSYVVNINEVNKYVKGEGGYLLMSDGSNIDVSRSKKEIVVRKLQNKV